MIVEAPYLWAQRNAQYKTRTQGADVIVGGDSASVKPEAFSQKWKGECWLKVSHADALEMQVHDREKVRRVGGKTKIEIPVSTKKRRHSFQEGSLKWDVIYEDASALPVDGIERFQLDFPEGLTWYYQGELTPEEIAEGAERPENVVGSYAGYFHKSGRFLDDQGNEIANYETGKFAHLYRPEMVDAVGNRAWASQEIVGNELRVTLPQEWMATAVYPITLDPTFGYSSLGGSGSGVGFLKSSGTYSPATNGTLDSITIGTLGAPTALVGGIYSNGASYPSSLIDSTSEKTTAFDTNWNTIAFNTGAAILSSTSYWLAFDHQGSNAAFDSTTGITRLRSSQTYTGTMPSTFPAGAITATNSTWSVYATYTESGGGVTETPSPAAINITELIPNLNITEIPNINTTAITGQDVIEITSASEIPDNVSVVIMGLDVNTLISITESPSEAALAIAGQDLETAVSVIEQVLTASLVLVGNDIILPENIIVSGVLIRINGRQVTVTGDEVITIIRQSGLNIGIKIGL